MCEHYILIEVRLLKQQKHSHHLNHINGMFDMNMIQAESFLELLMKLYLKIEHGHQQKFQDMQQKYYDK